MKHNQTEPTMANMANKTAAIAETKRKVQSSPISQARIVFRHIALFCLHISCHSHRCLYKREYKRARYEKTHKRQKNK